MYHPSHQSIPLTQGPKHEIFTKKFLFPLHENQSKLLGYQGYVEIVMIILVYSKRVSVRNNLLHSEYGLCSSSMYKSTLLYTLVLYALIMKS
jgi:hypothetical protein